jgi:hypothetical protein
MCCSLPSVIDEFFYVDGLSSFIVVDCRLSSGRLSIVGHSLSRAGIFKQSMGARNQVGIGLSYRPARLHRLAEFIPWNRFLGSMNV